MVLSNILYENIKKIDYNQNMNLQNHRIKN